MTEISAKEKWGLPDWREADEYPSPDATMRLWGWEFLRRRDDYRGLWNTYAEYAEQGPDGVLRSVTNEVEALRTRFGLSLMVDPKVQFSDFDLAQMFWPAFGYGQTIRSPEGADHDRDAGKKPIVFDLTRPIEPQLAKARAYLLRIQDECGGRPISPKNRIQNWPNFLRVLDARECGATWQFIAETIWPGQTKPLQSARDQFKPARAVQSRAPFFM